MLSCACYCLLLRNTPPESKAAFTAHGSLSITKSCRETKRHNRHSPLKVLSSQPCCNGAGLLMIEESMTGTLGLSRRNSARTRALKITEGSYYCTEYGVLRTVYCRTRARVLRTGESPLDARSIINNWNLHAH